MFLKKGLPVKLLFGCHAQLCTPYFVGIVLNPSRLRKNLCKTLFERQDFMLPFFSKTMARSLWVPWSNDRIYFSIKQFVWVLNIYIYSYSAFLAKYFAQKIAPSFNNFTFVLAIRRVASFLASHISAMGRTAANTACSLTVINEICKSPHIGLQALKPFFAAPLKVFSKSAKLQKVKTFSECVY